MLTALAQISPPPVATYHGFDLTPLIGALISLVALAIGWLTKRAAAAAAASTATSKAQLAGIKLAAIGAAMLGKAWDTLSPRLQVALADGTISAQERAEIETAVKGLLADFTSEDELKGITEALGLPLPGVVAKIASYLIGQFTAAHDPTIPTASAKAYPVADATLAAQGLGG